MNRQHDGGKAYPASGQPSAAVPFIHRLTASAAFKDLFGQGMTLVQEAAAYLDGPGRKESQDLARAAALAYGRESMRLTTRLMQVASWLLLQRAVNEGELTPVQALAERHRVRLTPEPLDSAPEIFEQLPPTLRHLSLRSFRLQERVIHLDRSLAIARSPEAIRRPCEIASQHERLRAAFAMRKALL